MWKEGEWGTGVQGLEGGRSGSGVGCGGLRARAWGMSVEGVGQSAMSQFSTPLVLRRTLGSSIWTRSKLGRMWASKPSLLETTKMSTAHLAAASVVGTASGSEMSSLPLTNLNLPLAMVVSSCTTGFSRTLGWRYGEALQCGRIRMQEKGSCEAWAD